jgi:lactate dehydrogenase-like 2-hydroxyacid dehydrogenase
MAITVLVPDDFGMSALSGIEGVELVRYDVRNPLPPEAERAQVLIPGFLAQRDTVELIRQLPNLKLIQLMSAGCCWRSTASCSSSSATVSSTAGTNM